MISQPEVEPLKYAGALTICSPAAISPAAAYHSCREHAPLLAPRTKPGAVIRPGLGTLLKDISSSMSPRYMSRSRKLHFHRLAIFHNRALNAVLRFPRQFRY
jgi:hypothetical protein